MEFTGRIYFISVKLTRNKRFFLTAYLSYEKLTFMQSCTRKANTHTADLNIPFIVMSTLLSDIENVEL